VYRWLNRKKIPTRILVIQTAKMGDLVCATPVIHALRDRYPSASISVLANPTMIRILRHDVTINHLLETPRGGFKGLRQKWRLIRLLHEYRFDTVIGLNPALHLWLAPVWAGVTRHAAIVAPQLGRTLRWTLPWLTHTVRHRIDQSIMITYRQLLATLDIPTSDFKKRLIPAPDAATHIDRLIGHVPERRCIGLGIASANALRGLPDELLIHLTTRLLETGYHVILIGGPSDQNLADTIMQSLNLPNLHTHTHTDTHTPESSKSISFWEEKSPARLINAVGKTEMDELVTLMDRLDVFIGIDSGPTHCAEAAGTPLVILFGPTPPAEQYPLDVAAVCLSPVNLDCAPCSFVYKTVSRCRNRCHPNACMRQFSVEQIIQSVRQLIDKINH